MIYFFGLKEDGIYLIQEKMSEKVPENVIWVSCHEITEEESAWLKQQFGIHQTARSQQKIDRHQRTQLNFAKVIHEIQSGPKDRCDRLMYLGRIKYINSSEGGIGFYNSVGFYLAHKTANQYLVTVSFEDAASSREGHLPLAPHLVQNVNYFYENNTSARSPKLFKLILSLILASLRREIELLDDIEGHTDQIASEIMKVVNLTSGTQKESFFKINLYKMIKEISLNRENLNRLWKSLIRSVEFLEGLKNTLPSFTEDDSEFLLSHMEKSCKRVYDECHNYLSHAEALGQRLEQLGNTTQSIIQFQQNQSNKALTLIAGLFVIPNLIAGFMGMNFATAPEITWPLGMALVFSIMAGTSYIMYRFIRKKWGN